jgi:Tol biopolymer transport system component
MTRWRRGLSWIALGGGLLGGCSPAGLVELPWGDRAVNTPYAETHPAISGRFLAFSSDRRNGQQVYLFDRETRVMVPLPGLNRPSLMAEEPAVSADGRWLVFTGSEGDRLNIYLYNREVRILRNLTANLNTRVRRPSISADGRRIAFEAVVNGQWDLVVLDQDGNPLLVP